MNKYTKELHFEDIKKGQKFIYENSLVDAFKYKCVKIKNIIIGTSYKNVYNITEDHYDHLLDSTNVFIKEKLDRRY